VTYDGSANHAAGTHSITAAYTSADHSRWLDSNSASTPVTVTVAKINNVTMGTIGSSHGVSYALGTGGTNLTVTLTPGNPAPAYTGTVQFVDGSTPISGTVTLTSAGITTTAALNGVFLTAGSHSITAQFVGDSNYNASSPSSPLAITVNKASSNPTTGTTSYTVTYGGKLTTTAISVPAVGSLGAPTGTLTLTVGPSQIGNGGTLSSGSFTFINAQLPASLNAAVGAQTLLVTYSGDSNYSSTTLPLSLTVNKATPTGTLTSNLASPPTFTLALSAPAGNAGTPGGTVNFYSDGGLLNATPIELTSGVASYASSLSGAHTITATYSGDGNFNASVSPYNLTGAQPAAATTTTVFASATNPTVGNTVTYTVSVTGGTSTPQGTVQISDNGNAICVGISVPGASQTCTVTYDGSANHTAGTHTITAAYTSADHSKWLDSNSASTPVTVTVVTVPCEYTLIPASASAPSGGGDGGFNISTGSACSWTAVVSDPSWITINSASSGLGNQVLTYTTAPNATGSVRNGSITVNGIVYNIQQFGPGCSFSINPSSLTVPSAGGPASIAVSASGANCQWTASGLSATPSTGLGGAIVTVAIPTNSGASSRALTATIGGQTFTVNQAGTACTVTLGSSSAAFSALGGTGTVTATTPSQCAYSTVLGPNWISVTSGGSEVGNGTVAFSVDPNPSTLSRSGALNIGGQTFLITQQAASCTVSVDTQGFNHDFANTGGTGSISITTNGTNCSWTASSPASWATVAPTSGTGNGPVVATVAANLLSTARSTGLNIGGQTVNVYEEGTSCSYSLQSTSASVPAIGGNRAVGVIAGSACGWTASTNTPSWLSIVSSGNAGTTDVQWSAQPNTSSSPRSGTLTIAGLTYTVTQAAAACVFNLSATTATVPSGGTSDSFIVSTSTPGCFVVPVPDVNWITVSTALNGTSTIVSYTVAANPSAGSRTGGVRVGGQSLAISQSGAACAFTLTSYSAAFNYLGGSGTITGTANAAGCAPAVSTGNTQMITLGVLSGPVNGTFTLPFTVSAFSSNTPTARTASISFGGQSFLVKQASY
jgi:hypothetical protein